MFYEVRYDFVEDGTVGFKAGVGVDFNKVDLVVGVDHEIHAKDFKVVDSPLRIDVHSRGVDDIGGYSLHFGVDHGLEVELGVLLLHELVQFFIADLIGLLVLAIVWQTLLHGVVGQVH